MYSIPRRIVTHADKVAAGKEQLTKIRWQRTVGKNRTASSTSASRTIERRPSKDDSKCAKSGTKGHNNNKPAYIRKYQKPHGRMND